MPARASKKTAALLINTASRKGKDSFEQAKQLLKEAGFTVDPHPIKDPSTLTAEMKKIVQSGQKLIVIGGGDGTVSEVVDEVAYTDVVLGVLPLGTANSFSRSLNVPADLPSAIAIIAGGKTAKIDLGKINDDYFANAVSIGFASSIAEDIPHTLKRYTGILAYGIQAVRNIGKLKPFQTTIQSGTEKSTTKTYQIVIANGGFYGPAPLVSKKRLQSADLSIFTFSNTKPLGILAIWLRSITGKKFSEQDMQRISVTDEVTLTTSPKKNVSIDGEIKTQTPIRVSIAPQAVTVLVAEDSKLQP